MDKEKKKREIFMEESSSLTLLQRWRKGDESAADALFHRYFDKLIAQAQRKISRKLARRVDAEDVVMSAYRSFFSCARDPGELLKRSGDVWGLLMCITLRKVCTQAHRHSRKKRGMDQEEHARFDDESLVGLLESSTPDPAVEVALEEEYERVMNEQEGRDRLILERWLGGEDSESIADDLKVSERTVRRVFKSVKETLKKRLENESGV